MPKRSKIKMKIKIRKKIGSKIKSKIGMHRPFFPALNLALALNPVPNLNLDLPLTLWRPVTYRWRKAHDYLAPSENRCTIMDMDA
jgi:hypothetical protein